MILFQADQSDEMASPCGYVNFSGDTIIPLGKYAYCFSDTIRDLGMVMEKETGKIIGIDQRGKELYEVFKYDNGPDYIESGLFRIIENNMIGYADPSGKVVIQPKFACAFPFEGDHARVSDRCETTFDGEHSSWDSEEWYRIGKDGRRIKE